jgi:hypothetical protein
VAIGMVLAPLISSIWVAGVAGLDLADWEAVAEPDGRAYHPLWKPVLLSDAVLSSFWLVASVTLLILFFRKHYVFPRLAVGANAFGFFTTLAGSVLSLQIPGFVADEDEFVGLIVFLVLAGLGALLWSLYFLKSKRVKATFVRHARGARGSVVNAEQLTPTE